MTKRLVAWLLLFFLSTLSFSEKKKQEMTLVFPDVTERGRALYEYDEAAWHATDAVQALHPPEFLIGRYIARKSDKGWTIVFGHLNEKRDAFLIAYEAIQGANLGEFTVKKSDPEREDTSFYLVTAKAIDTVLHDFQGQNRPYNVAVLPAPNNQFYVYILPAQTVDGVYPLGGDARYLIAPDGDTIVEKRQLHKSIIEIRPDSSKGTNTIAAFHTHVLSDVPEDTDVFHVLTRKPPQPEYIGTLNKKLYVINTDGTILEGKL